MKLKITKSNGEQNLITINKRELLFGRSPKCDVILSSSHISREHLKLYFANDNFFIEDITLSNWVAIDASKIAKKEKTPFFEFNKIFLPDNITIEFLIEDVPKSKLQKIVDPVFENNTGSVDLTIELENTQSSKKIKKNRSKPRYREKKQEEEKRKYLLLILILLAAGFFFFWDNSQEVTHIPQIQKKYNLNKRVNDRPQIKEENLNTEKNLSPTNIKTADIYSIKSTQTLVELDACKDKFYNICLLLFPDKTKNDVIIEKNGQVVIYKDFYPHLDVFFRDNSEAFHKHKNNENINIVLAAYNTLKHDVLKDLESKGIKSFQVVIYQKYITKVNIKGTYQIHSDVYRRYNMNLYKQYLEEFRSNHNYELFFSQLGKYIERN